MLGFDLAVGFGWLRLRCFVFVLPIDLRLVVLLVSGLILVLVCWW